MRMRWWPVFLRNLLVWRKLALPSLVGNIAEPLMWLVAFGYGMGSLVGEVQVGGQRVPYLLFLASGSICMSAMNAATFEALYSAFSRMHVQKTWDGILNAPVRLDDVVLAEMLWAAFKSLFTVSAILVVMLALGISHSPKLLVAWPILLLAGITFSCMALVFNALAKGYDFFTYYFTLFLTPMMFLSGVFFPLDQLPDWVGWLAAWLPLTQVVELVRPLFMDMWPTHPWRHLGMLALYAGVSFQIALVLTRRIGIDRVAKRNGFTPVMLRELSAAYTRLEDEPGLRVGVLYALGEHFTAGLDLPSMAESMQRGERMCPDGWVDPLDLGHPGLRRRTKPMVVAVQGITFTLGLELMLAADMVVAADNCRFAQLEVQRGIMPTGGATIRMAQRAGWGNAMRYLLTGDEFDSATALRLNWVQEVVPVGQQLALALAWADHIAAQAPLAVVATRQNALQALELGPAAAVQTLSDTQQVLSRSADATEGVRAFVEKRPPRFSGT